MGDETCPNAKGCILINNNDFGIKEREYYMQKFCFSSEMAYTSCKRYQTVIAFHFCPDFVLPDTELSLDEIIDKYDEGND